MYNVMNNYTKCSPFLSATLIFAGPHSAIGRAPDS